jgi:O-antigen/teichoic acid export membrane protein
VLSLGRALTSQPLVVRFSGPPGEPWREAVAASTGVLLALGVVGGLVCAAIGAAGGTAIQPAFVAMAVCMPGLMLQDGWRHAFFAVGRGRAAFVNDGIWAVIMLPVVVAIGGRDASIFWLVLAWGGAATVAAGVGVLQSGIRPRPALLSSWWRSQRDLGVRFAAESMTSVLSSQAVLYLLGAMVGLAAVGALRAGQLLLGPVNILLQGVVLVAVPEAVGALRISTRRMVRMVVLVSAVLGTLVAAFGALVLVLPPEAGETILGANWTAASPVLAPVAVGNTALALSLGALVGLRALAAATRSLRATVVVACLTLVVGIVGAALGGAAGAAWGLAVAAILGLAVWFRELRAGLRQRA